MHIVPFNLEIKDLEKRASELEKQAESALEPEASQLENAAKECRAWIAELQSGRWHS